MLMAESLFLVGRTVGSLLLIAACSTAAAPDAAEPPPQAGRNGGPQAVVPGKLIFHDGFEYDVPRNDRNARPAFITEGNWSGVKSENATGKGLGYLYTTHRIPGYAGPFPGRNSRRVLAIEARSKTLNNQTDFYLQYGAPRDRKRTRFRRTSGSSSGSIRTTTMTPKTRKISSADSTLASSSSIRASMPDTPRIPHGCSRWAGPATLPCKTVTSRSTRKPPRTTCFCPFPQKVEPRSAAPNPGIGGSWARRAWTSASRPTVGPW